MDAGRSVAVGLLPATEHDLETTYEIKRRAFGPYVELAYGWDEDDQRRRHREEFCPEHVRIIHVAGAAVGYLMVKQRTDELYLSQIFIDPAHQGQGIGERCMRLLAAEARRLGVPIRLQVLKVNPRALAFYLRFGFLIVGETDTHTQLAYSPGASAGTNHPATTL